MKLVLTAAEVEAMKEAFGGKESTFHAIETKCGSKALLEDGSMVIDIKPAVIVDFVSIFVRVQPTVVAMFAMVKSLNNQLADLGKVFADKWLK